MRRIRVTRAYSDSQIASAALVSMSEKDYRDLLNVAKAADAYVDSCELGVPTVRDAERLFKAVNRLDRSPVTKGSQS